MKTDNAGAFWEYVQRWKSKARLNVSDGWKLCQDQVLRDHILPHLSSKHVSEITPSDISSVIQFSKDLGHAENMQRKIYNVLSKLFSDAVHFFEILDRSPVKRRFHRPVVQEIERKCMNYEQALIFLEYVMNHPTYGIPSWIQVLSGARVSEVQALSPKDIDFETHKIRLSKAYNRHTKKIQKYTKNKKHYYVPITPMLFKYLKKNLKKGIFACPDKGGGMLSDKRYDNFLKEVADKLGFDCKSSHLLRHACAKIFAEKGASDEDLQSLLGHKCLSSTKTYIHRDDKNLFEISKKIS